MHYQEKKGESLIINNNIEIIILESHGDQVKIGISAPKEIPVYRKEVYLQIQKENEDSMHTDKIGAINDLLNKK